MDARENHASTRDPRSLAPHGGGSPDRIGAIVGVDSTRGSHMTILSRHPLAFAAAVLAAAFTLVACAAP